MVYPNSNVHRSGPKYLSPALVSDPTFTQTVDPNSPSLPCCSQRVPTTLRCPPPVEEGKMSGKSSVSHCSAPYTLNVSTKLKLTLQQQHVSTDGVIRPMDCMMKETFSWVLSSSCHPTVCRAINYPLVRHETTKKYSGADIESDDNTVLAIPGHLLNTPEKSVYLENQPD